MSLNFKKRIAFHFIVATAIVIAVVFGIVYLIVQQTVYRNIDNDLSFEANKHTKEIYQTEDGIKFIHKGEWEETEHREVQVNPVFIQLTNKLGEVTDKSPNLKEDQLIFKNENKYGDHFNTKLKERFIRQAQIPIEKNGKINGYIIAAMSLDGSLMVLENLRNTLLFLFPIVLIGLFFISSFLAGKSISPVVLITNTANRITKNNLNERIELPQNEDELYDLSSSINSLIDRLGKALEREKQFTSDASHELRTPISIIKGTLEVLIRKDRNVEEYREKINYSLKELDRMAIMIEQLLVLARFDSNTELATNATSSIVDIMNQIIIQRTPSILDKNIDLVIHTEDGEETELNTFHTHLILDNILSNAIKYSHLNGKIEISIRGNSNAVSCQIKDYGIGIKKSDIQSLYTPFFRSDALNHKDIKGVGLGLSIVQKAAAVCNAEILIHSDLGKGTAVDIRF
ncbi:HAMP domain-containing protein [Brumimicrobium glaciale]|uniref:histidine kinase n=1 Tax=Brumimicrobium glaciale TaxID=200475 RepID=A0A4Q4KSU0_9FLAO|nr:ATP-binding protein [Brumimicrobium glaciale]RYM36042.1 HAMP domain-containing protein [Brumimicrobium glaciale]